MKDNCYNPNITYLDELQNALINMDNIILSMKDYLESLFQNPEDPMQPVLDLLKELVIREIEIVDYLICNFDSECFICSPLRILQQLLRTSSYLHITLGDLNYTNEFPPDVIPDFCTLTVFLDFNLFMLGEARTYIRSTIKTYRCPCK